MTVTISRPSREAGDFHPDWTKDAACLGRYSREDGQDPFFDYGRNAAKILAAKRICVACPVRRECLRDNIGVPRGIFGGYTETERWQLLGRGRRRPTSTETYRFFRV